MIGKIVDIFNTYGLIVELLLACVMFTWHLKRREMFWLRLLAACTELMCSSLLWGLVQPHSALWQSVWYMLLLAGCLWGVVSCFQVSVRQAVFYVTAAGAAQHFAFKVGRTCEYYTFHLLGPQPWIRTVAYPLYIVPPLLMCWLLFAQRLVRADPDELRHTYVSAPLTGMLLCTDLIQCLHDEYADAFPPEANTLLNVSAMITCLFILAFLCETVERSKEAQSNAILRHMLHQQKEQLAASKDTIDLINVKCHDVKNQLSMLEDRVLPETIDDLNRTLTIYDGVPHTGSEALDVLLAESALLCQQKDIRLDYMVNGDCLSFLRPADIYSMLGNAMSNAVDAAAKCPDEGRRYIKLRISVEKGMVMLHLENRYTGKLDFDGELPRTTKQDKHYHGFGMKSIRLITERYHGYLKVKTTEDIFTLNILLPIPM